MRIGGLAVISFLCLTSIFFLFPMRRLQTAPSSDQLPSLTGSSHMTVGGPTTVTPAGIVQSMFTRKERDVQPVATVGRSVVDESRRPFLAAQERQAMLEGIRPWTAVVATVPMPNLHLDTSRLPPSVIVAGPSALLSSFVPQPPKGSVQVGRVVPFTNPLSQDSSRPKSRAGARQTCLDNAAAALQRPIPPNLRLIAQVLANHLVFPLPPGSGPGYLTGATLASAMAELDVTDIIVCDGLFTLLDLQNDNKLPLHRVLGVVDLLVNGPSAKRRIRMACFEMFEINSYITKGHLTTLRCLHATEFEALKARGITAAMIRALTSVVDDIMRCEEEEFIAAMLKAKKGGKKKVPPLKPNQRSHIPVTRRRREHISYDTFDRYFDNSPELAMVFLPRVVGVLLSEGALQHLCMQVMPSMVPPVAPAPTQ